MNNNIGKERKKVRVTQVLLAKTIGWSVTRLANYEYGLRNPGLNDCRKIVRAINEFGANCTLDSVFPPEEEDLA